MKLIRIQSTQSIAVTSGLNYKDVTNPDAHVADRLKVSAEWPKCTVIINKGVGDYPAEIAEWPTVKALVKDNILTIGAVKEAQTADEIKQVETFAENKKLVEQNETKKRRTRKNLSELTQED